MRNLTAIMAIIIVIAFIVGLSTAGFAQADRKISLDLKDAPIRQALQQLFMGSGVSYSIDAEVPADRRVELHLRDVDLKTALSVLVRSAGLTFRQEGETYLIGVQQAQQVDPNPGQMTSMADPGMIEAPPAVQRIEKIPLIFADAVDIASFLGAEATQSRGSMLSGGGGGMGGGMGGFGGGMGGSSFGGMSGYGGSGSSNYGSRTSGGSMGGGFNQMRAY